MDNDWYWLTFYERTERPQSDMQDIKLSQLSGKSFNVQLQLPRFITQKIYDHRFQWLNIQNQVFQSYAKTFVHILITLYKKKRSLRCHENCCASQKLQIKSVFILHLFFFVPYSSQMYLCGFQFYSNKGWLMKVTHFWLMDMSVNWRRQTLQIELLFSIVHTLAWFLMHQSHKMSLFKGNCWKITLTHLHGCQNPL